MWVYKDPSAAWNFFVAWYRTPLHSVIEHLIRLARTLRDYWEGNAAHYRYLIHTPVLEGINNKAKVIVRVAFGYRDNPCAFLKLRAVLPLKAHPFHAFSYS